MKLSVILTIALLLTAGLAWAEEATPSDATPAAEQTATAPADPADGGGCMLPDLGGLGSDEAQSALLKEGFGLSSTIDTATPMCPVKFSCSSIVNCGAGSLCVAADIGPCCVTSSGLTACCIQGTIKVRSCPCVCTGNPCNIQCPNSTDVKWRCS